MKNSMSPIRFAIIGSGAIASKHAQALAAVPEARLVAVWSRSPEQGEKFAAGLGVEFVSGLDDLAVRTDIDAVTIATPSGIHGMSAMPFLKNGKAVLCEKPLEITLEKVDNLLAAAKDPPSLRTTGSSFGNLMKKCRGTKRSVTRGAATSAAVPATLATSAWKGTGSSSRTSLSRSAKNARP
jgi:hypothetical protein